MPLATRSTATRTSAPMPGVRRVSLRSEEHTSELQSQSNLVCRLLLEKKKSRAPMFTDPSPSRHGARLVNAGPDHLAVYHPVASPPTAIISSDSPSSDDHTATRQRHIA